MGAIENLPEEIIHRIQSFLEAQEAAKTSVLSKLWLRAWRTQPILQCDQNYFRRRKKFSNYVNRSLLRYQEKKISIDKFTLIFRIYDWTSFLYKWIRIAIAIGLKKLELVNVPRQSSLPAIVFQSELLEDLSINNHPFYNYKLQFPEKISCFRLKRLSFSNISFDEGAIEKLLSICQCIEFLNICKVDVKRDHLMLLAKNLRELYVDSCEFHMLEVEAPNLECFTCSDCFLYLKTTSNLRFLKLFRTRLLNENWLSRNIFAKLENLIIQDCRNLTDLKVTSQTALKNLYVDSCDNLKYLFVDSLDTIRFDFYSRKDFIPITSFTNHLSTCSVSNIHLDVLDSTEFLRLKKLLRNLMSSRISLNINGIIDMTTVSKHVGGLEEEYELPIPIHELSLGQPSSAFSLTEFPSEFPPSLTVNFSAILDGLFCTCRPTIIKLVTSPPFYHWCDYGFYGKELKRLHDNELAQLLVGKVMVKKNQFEDDEILTKEIQSWERDLKEVKVDFLTKNDQGEWKPESWNWETFLDMISKVQVLICVTCDWV